MNDHSSDLFMGLVASLQMSAWMALGKIMNPMTHKAERNLEQAKETIDVLGVLEERTRGNLSDDESRALTRILYELRMNYVEELKTPPAAAPAPAPAAPPLVTPPPAGGAEAP
jgi:hypothetical protein